MAKKEKKAKKVKVPNIVKPSKFIENVKKVLDKL